MTEQTNKVDQLTRIIQSVKEVSVIVGICAGLFGLYTAARNEQRNTAQARMAGLSAVDKFIADDSAIRAEVGKFLQEYSGQGGREKLRELLRKYGSGERAYESQELQSMRNIGRHYERMGLYVKLDYLDFDLVYEVVSFPDDFWAETEEFRATVQKSNWSASGAGLPDFWRNFADLERRFQERRAQVRT